MAANADRRDPADAPRRRPRRAAADRRADVLAAARWLFAARGFHATTTRELAEAADLNDALLYRYFPSKEAILAALVDEAIDAFAALPVAFPAAPPGPGVPLAGLLELAGTAFVRTATAQLDLLTILVSEHQTLADDHRFVQFIHDAATGLGQIIDQAAGTRDGSGYLTARAFMGAMIAFVLLQNVLGMTAVQPVDPAAYITHLATLTARGLGAAP